MNSAESSVPQLGLVHLLHVSPTDHRKKSDPYYPNNNRFICLLQVGSREDYPSDTAKLLVKGHTSAYIPFSAPFNFSVFSLYHSRPLQIKQAFCIYFLPDFVPNVISLQHF